MLLKSSVQSSAQRDHQVEERQVASVRPQSGQFSVAAHQADEQGARADPDLRQDLLLKTLIEGDTSCRKGHGEERTEDRSR